MSQTTERITTGWTQTTRRYYLDAMANEVLKDALECLLAAGPNEIEAAKARARKIRDEVGADEISDEDLAAVIEAHLPTMRPAARRKATDAGSGVLRAMRELARQAGKSAEAESQRRR